MAVRAVNFASSAQLEGEIYPLTVCTVVCLYKPCEAGADGRTSENARENSYKFLFVSAFTFTMSAIDITLALPALRASDQRLRGVEHERPFTPRTPRAGAPRPR